jgi:thiamine-phosphate pyrophosphorylase
MINTLDLSLYLVTKRENLLITQFLDLIDHAVKGGVTIVQLREKDMGFDDLCVLARQVQEILKPQQIPLIINDRIDVAKEVKADGVHLGRSERKIELARKVLGKNAIIGLSVETIKQVVEAQNIELDYLAASPVFPSVSKTDCYNPWGLDGLKYLCSISRHPIIGVGGINRSNVEDIIHCGASGIAVISAIFDAQCAFSEAQYLSDVLKNNKLQLTI